MAGLTARPVARRPAGCYSENLTGSGQPMLQVPNNTQKQLPTSTRPPGGCCALKAGWHGVPMSQTTENRIVRELALLRKRRVLGHDDCRQAEAKAHSRINDLLDQWQAEHAKKPAAKKQI